MVFQPCIMPYPIGALFTPTGVQIIKYHYTLKKIFVLIMPPIFKQVSA